MRLIGAARGTEIRLQSSRLQRTIEAAPAFAGGDAENSLLAQGLEQIADAAKELHCVLGRAEMPAIALDEFRDALGPQSRDRVAQRVVKTETDDVARLLLRRHLQVQIGRGEPNAFRDGASRVDDRAVPVEDHE